MAVDLKVNPNIYFNSSYFVAAHWYGLEWLHCRPKGSLWWDCAPVSNRISLASATSSWWSPGEEQSSEL